MKTLIAVVLSLVCSLAMAEEKPAVSEPKPVRVKEGERKDNVTRFGGTIAVVTASSLTVTMGGGDGGRAPREETVSLNAETKVLVESDEMEEVKGEGGQKRQRAKKVDGAVADLKVGQRVYVRAKDGVVSFKSNQAGGITGGLTTGQPIVARLAVKPTPTIAKDQETIDKVSLENAALSAVTRRDPTIVARVWPVAEAFMAIILLDHYMMHLGYQALIPRKA